MIIQKSELDGIVQAVVDYHKSHEDVLGYDEECSIALLDIARERIGDLGFDRLMMEFGLFDLITGCLRVTDDCTSDDIARVLEVLGWTVEL